MIQEGNIKNTHQSPFSSLKRLAHGPKSNNVHTSEETTDQHADQGEDCKISREGVVSSALDLQDHQDGTVDQEAQLHISISNDKKSSKSETHDKRRTEIILYVIHSRITESMNDSHVDFNLSYWGGTLFDSPECRTVRSFPATR